LRSLCQMAAARRSNSCPRKCELICVKADKPLFLSQHPPSEANPIQLTLFEPRTTRAELALVCFMLPNREILESAARNALLDDEIALRAQIEAVAAKRRALRGELPKDYVFERIGKTSMPENVKMSELFSRHDTLIILYCFMYGPERELPCPGCTHLLDGLDGAARHVGQRASLHIVAKSPIARLAAWAHERGWGNLSLLSTAGNSYDADYFGDTSKFSKGNAHATSSSGLRELGRNNFQRLQKEERRDQTLLGLRDELRSSRSQTAPPRWRSRRPALGSSRYNA
jgi:predicted dithiol-disulfide oxidoreductase (DUF899 family)